MSDTRPRLHLSLDWKSVLAIVLMLPVLISLGFWQLLRADEKTALLAASEALRQREPVSVESLTEYPNYLPVWAEGVFDQQHYWLLDNRIFQGRFGYEIIALLTLGDGRQVLINRGWLPGDKDRTKLPVVDFPKGKVKVAGELYRGVGKQYSLGEYRDEGWPRRQQWLEIDALLPEFPGLLPAFVRLNENSLAAFRVQHTVVNVSPQKHTAYAVQWFSMAAVLAIIFVMRNSNIVDVIRGQNRS